MLQNKKWGLYVLTLMCSVAAMVCVICDYAITKTLTWSLIVLLALAAGWLISIPLFRAERNVIKKILIIIGIITIPFLAGISAVLKLPIILYGVFVKYQKRIFLAVALSLLILIPLVCGITHIAAYFVKSVSVDFVSDLFHIIITLLLSGTCLIVDLLRLHHANSRKGQIE